MAAAFGLGVEALAGLVADAVRSSFLPPARKSELLAQVAAARDDDAEP